MMKTNPRRPAGAPLDAGVAAWGVSHAAERSSTLGPLTTQILADRYELTECIGSGAMGEVWAATDLTTGTELAVKLLAKWAANEPELISRFEREAKLLRRIKCPYVCSLIDAGRDQRNVPFLVLERLRGETLAELLEREGYLPLADIAVIGDEILQALVAAHGVGIVHRDLSPSNVFMHQTLDGATITKLVDFGIAKASDASAPRTGGGAMMGSLAYVAPEQLGDSANAQPSADLYAFGALVFRALAGRLPYGDIHGTALVVMKREHEAPTIDEATGEKWPAALRTFLAKTIARSPAKRYPSAEVALTAWRAAANGKARTVS